MIRHRRARRLIWTRRLVQTAALALFLVLLAANRPTAGEGPAGPVELFFDLDPLVLAGTWLAARSLADLSLLALVTVLITLVLGRVFCGWFCPLGTLHNAVGSLRRYWRRHTAAGGGFSRWQRAKYFIVIALIAMAVGGVHWIGVLDPISLLYRSLALCLVPAADLAVSAAANAVYLGNPQLGAWQLRDVTEPVYRWWQDHVAGTELRVFLGSGVILLVFLGALVLNFARQRFWCRYVCPLGGLLGLIARRPWLRLVSDPAACNHCRACTLSCPAAAQPEQPDRWLATECFGCWNCVAACKQQGLDFRWVPPWRRTSAGTVDLKKRRVLAAIAGGIGAVALMRITPTAQGKTYNPVLIRPPGALPEQDFLRRCVQCGLCMQACPTGGLQPTWHEAGLAGVWTPQLVPAIGFCEYECHACGQVCPTGAIAPVALADKKKIKIGLAVIDTTRCLPYAYGRECIVCEEHCPVPDKAITFELRESRGRDGSVKILKFPRVDPDRCTGCGICETKCPFNDRAAIAVTSAGESRHPANQPLLRATMFGPPAGDEWP
ncbi:MAG: 4Fe-4S dicluster domain-containing protein [Candidatus Krumholzibacteria bacterium]|nr:4Fe-4S dicluster domain-containing protein [Candidatus Krumholzibacteria bacterium]